MGTKSLSFPQMFNASSPLPRPSLHGRNMMAPWGSGGEARRGPQQPHKTPLWAAKCSPLNLSTSGLHSQWLINSF